MDVASDREVNYGLCRLGSSKQADSSIAAKDFRIKRIEVFNFGNCDDIGEVRFFRRCRFFLRLILRMFSKEAARLRIMCLHVFQFETRMNEPPLVINVTKPEVLFQGVLASPL
ncbi:hypothetical protein LOAG_14800 [Loa loa]|uniref:Uncharacterized protein n=1 Tax=Loa loa TaxID=7209 RepID=A0A1S0TH38_LOALO|nr:hypothetical protein LOAG_14800 [Loa loa]EFO13728.1 hypothetical protein LOAG_14800 [Loa loa]